MYMYQAASSTLIGTCEYLNWDYPWVSDCVLCHGFA